MFAASLRAALAAALIAGFGASTFAVDPPAKTSPVKLSIHRASQLIGMNVQNAKREDIGKINDIVIANDGQVRYFAISFGTTFGFGGKLFAVPFKAVELRYDSLNNSHFVLFDVKKEQLDKAPGFASDKWPDFADETFTGSIDKFYDAQGTRSLAPPR
jgi:sporulation protein YlmC with PRC-barrel domain